MDLTPAYLQGRLRHLAPAAKLLLVAVSGGVDSVVLLRLLVAARLPLQVAHFDHALRDESADDAAFVSALAADLGLRVSSERADVARIAADKGWNLEDAARRLRYAFLHRVASRVGADAIVTAHTLDDQAETVLMQLLRGAAYLPGMPARQGLVVRPLLTVAKRELVAVAQRGDFSYRHDVSNDDRGRRRAWLRHEIVPRLEANAPGLGERLAQLALVQADVADFVRGEAERRLGGGPLALGALRRAPPALQREAVAGLLRRAGAEVDAGRIAAALDAAASSTPRRIALSADATLRAAYGRLEVVAAPEPSAPALAITAAADLPEGVPPRALAHFGELELRGPRPGDRIRLPGGSRKVSDVLIDAKVPREQRPQLRVLASGGWVHWIDGVAVSTELSGLGAASPDPDLPYMLQALALADRAADAGELPVGALVVAGGVVVGTGHNRSEADRDPSAHAELLALRAAAATAGDWRLERATLYVTLEPCAMCFGAALQAHLHRIVYGADNLREGALGSVVDLGAAPWKRKLEVRSGLLASASARRLTAFFEQRRAQGGAASG